MSPLLQNRQRRSRLKIYVHQRGKILGPYSRDEIRRHLVNGEVSLSDSVWHDRIETWVALRDLPSSESEGERYEMPKQPESRSAEPSASFAAAPVRKRVRERSAPVAPPVRKGWFERLFGSTDAAVATHPPARRRSESRRSFQQESLLSQLAGGQICGFDVTPKQELHLFCKTATGRRCTVKMGGLKQLRVHQLTLGEPIESTALYTESNVPGEFLVRLERDEAATAESITKKYHLAKSGWNLLEITGRDGCRIFALLDRSAAPPRESNFDDDF